MVKSGLKELINSVGVKYSQGGIMALDKWAKQYGPDSIEQEIYNVILEINSKERLFGGLDPLTKKEIFDKINTSLQAT
ncbi:MAG: hypothetical protein ABH811_00255 [archaeon]